jgi:hypothetical protein
MKVRTERRIPKKPMRKRNDYEVGKGRPPQHTRFKPGQSGNPQGRPKGIKNLKTLLANALNQKVSINEGGHRRTVSVREAILMRFVSMGLKGDLKVIMALLEMEPAITTPVKFSPETEAAMKDPVAASKVYANMVRQVIG